MPLAYLLNDPALKTKVLKYITPITKGVNVYQGDVRAQEETVTLIPYGFTKVRVIAFPVVK